MTANTVSVLELDNSIEELNYILIKDLATGNIHVLNKHKLSSQVSKK